MSIRRRKYRISLLTFRSMSRKNIMSIFNFRRRWYVSSEFIFSVLDQFGCI